MCILLCLGQTKLCLSALCQVLTECIYNMLFFKCDQLVRDRLIIVLKADKCCLNERTVKSGKLVITECTCHFTGTVRTEVKEDHGIILFYNRDRFSILCNYGRKYELVCYILCIRIFHCLYGIFCLNALPLCQGIIGFLYTIPVIITIHCIVTSG